jgi:hypothetical protein
VKGKQNLMKKVIAALALAGCVSDTERWDQAHLEQKYKAAAEQAAQQYREAMEPVWQLERACFTALEGLKIGVATIKDTVGLPCRPDHINTTETANVIRNQYVYGLGESWNAYLYFENGRLVAKQV